MPAAPSSPESLPRFIIGDDCSDAAPARLFVIHLNEPRFVLRVEFSAEQGNNVFHPAFLDDISKLAPGARDRLIREAVSFYNAAWRRAIAPVVPA